MTLSGRVACCARPCGRTRLARLLRPGEVEWICEQHWHMIPKVDRTAYNRAVVSGATQLGDAIWLWASCRQAAINAEAAARWAIVDARTLCQDKAHPEPIEGVQEGI